ncbi:MAG: hypothetical protein GX776_06995 [Oxalobacter sp.]|nr:hypothetical protein [Oxalobacter sp.]
MNEKIKCSYCGTDCQMIEVGKETVARCFKCGSVHRDYDGKWLTDKDAILYLQKQVEAMRNQISAAGMARKEC